MRARFWFFMMIVMMPVQKAMHDTKGSDLQDRIEKLLASNQNLAFLSADESPLLNTNLYVQYSDKVEPLLKQGADPNIQNSTGYCPLEKAIYASKAPCVALLLQYGAKIMFTKRPHGALLDLAIGMGNADTVKYLLLYGANPNDQKNTILGYTPLISAIQFPKIGYDNRLQIVELLLCCGANPKIKNIHNKDALISAREKDNKKIGQLLIHFDEIKRNLRLIFRSQIKAIQVPEDIIGNIAQYYMSDLCNSPLCFIINSLQ